MSLLRDLSSCFWTFVLFQEKTIYMVFASVNLSQRCNPVVPVPNGAMGKDYCFAPIPTRRHYSGKETDFSVSVNGVSESSRIWYYKLIMFFILLCVKKFRSHKEASKSHSIIYFWKRNKTCLGRHGGTAVSISVAQLYGPWFGPDLGFLAVWVLQLLPIRQKHASQWTTAMLNCPSVYKWCPVCIPTSCLVFPLNCKKFNHELSRLNKSILISGGLEVKV